LGKWRDDGEERLRYIYTKQEKRVLSLSARLKYQKGPALFSLIIVLLFHSSESFKHVRDSQRPFCDRLTLAWVKISTRWHKNNSVNGGKFIKILK